MTREELEAALIAHEDDPYGYAIQFAPIFAAARKQLALMPEKCGTCGGRGVIDGNFGGAVCPTCHGSGKVYPQETVEKIAEALRQVTFGNLNASLTENRYPLIAVAVLDALGERITEQKATLDRREEDDPTD